LADLLDPFERRALLKSLTSSASGQRVLRSLAFRSASTASVTEMR
jgi:hypothetical protein